jgi:hypothetical protein
MSQNKLFSRWRQICKKKFVKKVTRLRCRRSSLPTRKDARLKLVAFSFVRNRIFLADGKKNSFGGKIFRETAADASARFSSCLSHSSTFSCFLVSESSNNRICLRARKGIRMSYILPNQLACLPNLLGRYPHLKKTAHAALIS